MARRAFRAACLLGGLAGAAGCDGILGIYELSDGGPSGSEAGPDAGVSDVGVGARDVAEDKTAIHDGSMSGNDVAKADEPDEDLDSPVSTGDVRSVDTGPADAPSCTPGTQQCSDTAHVETCNANGEWGDIWACATGTCSGGACTGSTTTATSCPAAGGAGLNNCGAGGSGTESCCTSLEVPGGTYDRTYTNSGTGATGEADPASISGFRLDKYLVTVGRFRQFVAAWNAGYYPRNGSGIHTHLNGGQGLANSGQPGTYETGWDATDWNNVTDIDPTNANLLCDPPEDTWTNTAGSQENLPINCVDWWESYAFCIWDGGFLPSEAEWEYAAAGGSQQREYPWGTAAPGTACPGTGCEYAIYGCEYPSGSVSCTGVANIAPVGFASLGVGTWGQFDLAGEVLEWNLDWYLSPYVDPCIDCAYLTTASSRVFRGGFFVNTASDLLPPIRSDDFPADRDGIFGFRCARTP